MIDLYSASSNLGDNLSLTPLMRATECRVHLFDDDSVRSISPIFDGLGEVIFDNGSPTTHPPVAGRESPISGPHSKKILAWHGYYDYNAIPKINLTDEELKWAHHYLEDSQLLDSCIVKASTQKTNYRTPPKGLMDSIVEKNPQTKFLSSGLTSAHPKNNFVNIPIKNTLTMWDYPIRKLAAIYAIVGRYIGPDTGDYHLMLAVGGKADVLVPDSIWHYEHRDFHYTDKCFTGEPVRVKYHRWSQPLSDSICGLSL